VLEHCLPPIGAVCVNFVHDGVCTRGVACPMVHVRKFNSLQQ
jgi:hypothetical protein